MNNPKSENKSNDHEDGDHTQPINLVAARTAVPVTGFSSSGTTVSTQSLAMRTHMDSKPGLMTLYFRAQGPRAQGQVMGPIVGAQVSSSQHFAAKSTQDFKNTTSFTVIRMPSDMSQVQSGTTTPSSSGTLTPGILPSALSGGSTRHMIPTAVQPVIATGHSGSSLASLIRGSHQVSPAAHVIHPPFSSHVPRGPAAVASISAAPKSAVATPILRTPHSSATMALASSSMMALHTPVRVKSPTLASRTATPPVAAATTSIPQVVDLQKSTLGHTLPSNATHIGMNSRSVDGSIVRTGTTHPSGITLAKPVNISQPIVQHLQQVYDKGALKAVSNMVSTTTAPSSSHQSTPPAFTSVSETGSASTLSRTPVSSSYSNIMQLSSANVGQPLQQLRTAHVPQGIHALTSVSSGSSQQTLTVIAAKSLVPTNHSVALAAPRSAAPITAVSATGGNISIVPGPTPRSLTITNAITPATISVAKVYPQSTSVARTTSETTLQENIRTSSFVSQGLSSSTTRIIAPTATTASPLNVMISDKQPENNPVRFTTLTKPPVGSSSSYSPSSTTYLYHDQYASNLSMHPYTTNQSSQNFTTTQLRPVSFSQHTSNASSHSPISAMVSVDSRHHMTIHPPYGSCSGKSSDASVPVTLSSSNSTTVTTTVTSVVSTSYNSLQPQSSINNHTSPRPSILRKRPSDSICNIVKKNLTATLNSSEPASPRPEFNSNTNFTSVLSPKPTSTEKSKEIVPCSVPASTESQNILIPVIPAVPAVTIKKEPGVIENSNSTFETLLKDSRPIEASPRKKPRKQLLAANELMETHSSDGEENNFDVKVKIKEEPDEEKPKYITYYKRPTMSLLNSYRQTWKSRHNHFSRYSDVKPKEEKKPTVSELANQKGILQQANGWKIYHLTAQMDEVIGLEESVYSRLSDLLEFVENDPPALRNCNSLNNDEVRILSKLNDLIKGNMQRSKIVQEQVSESKQQAIKVLDHKTNVIEMVNKYISKRPLKKKEKS